MNIDWKQLSKELCIYEDGDPEAILHELAHAYDCIGKKAFEFVGTQRTVRALIDRKYATDHEANLAEVKVSAVTCLLLPSEHSDIVMNLLQNLPGDWFRRYSEEDTREMFTASTKDPTTIAMADSIRDFLVKNFHGGVWIIQKGKVPYRCFPDGGT